MLQTAKKHYDNCDYKAAAVYTRSAFEKMLQKYCQNQKKEITFKPRLKDYTSEDFWNTTKTDIDPTTKSEIEQYRTLVLNPFSHYDTEKHELKTELHNAIAAVEKLKNELKILCSKNQ